MVPGMGSLRDELNKIPGVRPSPVGQENIPVSNLASCPSMNYSPNNYRGQQAYPQQGHDNNYQQQIPYHQSSDQHSNRSGSASMSSSSTSLNNDFYPQGANYAMNANQGFVNPIYQTVSHQNYQDMSTAYSQADGAAMNMQAFANVNNYQQPTVPATGMNQYGNHAVSYGQQQPQHLTSSQQQYDFYKNQGATLQQPSTDNFQIGQPNINYSQTSTHNSYLNPALNPQQTQANIDQIQNPYQNQYQTPQQYPLTQSPAQHQQHYSAAPSSNLQQQNLNQQQQQPQQQYSVAPQNYPVAQSPLQQQLQYPQAPSPAFQQPQQQQYPVAQPSVFPQYSAGQQYQNQSVLQPSAIGQNPPTISVPQAPTMSQLPEQQHSVPQIPGAQDQQQNFVENVSHIVGHQDLANQQQNHSNYASNQPYVINRHSQQNYSCYTPTINAVNSYMTAGDTQTTQSQTTQSGSYSQTPEVLNSHGGTHPASVDSPQHQPHSIPTYSAAVNAKALNNSEMHMTHSQQQITSPMEKQIAPVEVKSKNIDLLSGIDFSMTNPTVDQMPTLTPVSVNKRKEEIIESPKKVTAVEQPMPAPVKLNEDLADLDFNSLSAETNQEPVKPNEAKRARKLDDPFDDDGAVLKQFHKEVESLEKFMETLTIKTLNGVTPLANKWKELQDLLVKDEANRMVSVARLFPDKNRSVDCLPYDHARVLLPTTTDNYINAVLVKDCGPVGFILTQTPMPNTVIDYWEMVWSQKSNTLVCLHSTNEVRLLKY